MFSTFATGSSGNMSWTIIYIVAIAAMFYFMLIRPSKKQNKSRAEMLNALCVGDEIYTTGGILGTVTRIKEKTIWLRISEKCEIELLKDAIAGVNKNKKSVAEN